MLYTNHDNVILMDTLGGQNHGNLTEMTQPNPKQQTNHASLLTPTRQTNHHQAKHRTEIQSANTDGKQHLDTALHLPADTFNQNDERPRPREVTARDKAIYQMKNSVDGSRKNSSSYADRKQSVASLYDRNDILVQKLDSVDAQSKSNYGPEEPPTAAHHNADDHVHHSLHQQPIHRASFRHWPLWLKLMVGIAIIVLTGGLISMLFFRTKSPSPTPADQMLMKQALATQISAMHSQQHKFTSLHQEGNTSCRLGQFSYQGKCTKCPTGSIWQGFYCVAPQIAVPHLHQTG